MDLPGKGKENRFLGGLGVSGMEGASIRRDTWHWYDVEIQFSGRSLESNRVTLVKPPSNGRGGAQNDYSITRPSSQQ